MSIIATAVRHLMAAGVTGEDLIDAIAEMEAAQPKDLVAEKRRAYDRERKRSKRKAGKSGGSPVESADTADKNPFDKKSPQTPIKIKSKNPPIVPPFAEKLVEAWNRHAGEDGFTMARPLNTDRQAKLRRRVKEFGEEPMLDAIRRLSTSPFHRGENDRGWKADIGWLLKSSENVTKALEIEPPKPRLAASEPSSFLAHKLAKRRGQSP